MVFCQLLLIKKWKKKNPGSPRILLEFTRHISSQPNDTMTTFLVIFFFFSHSIDGQQTGWQSQKPRAPWGRQHKEIYKQEDEGCGVQTGKKKTKTLSRPSSSLSSLRGNNNNNNIFQITSTLTHQLSPLPFLLLLWPRDSFACALWLN